MKKVNKLQCHECTAMISVRYSHDIMDICINIYIDKTSLDYILIRF